MNSISELKCAIMLQYVLGLGSCKVVKIYEKYGNAYNFFYGQQDLKTSLLSPAEVSRLKSVDVTLADDILSRCDELSINCVHFLQGEYPDLLKEIDNPPVVLYYKGKLPDNSLPLFCIVGSRKLSSFGTKAAFSLGYRLTLGGISIVSGIANGADTQALRGALKACGKPVCIMPCGLGVNYLNEFTALRRDIISNGGCLLSECTPNMPVYSNSFHLRNRLLSGISLGVGVIEAAQKSGTLITAHIACEQGRDVFVIPGNPTDSGYKGSNELLCEGAIPLLNAECIFNQYEYKYPNIIDVEKAFRNCRQEIDNFHKRIIKKDKGCLSDDAWNVYNLIKNKVFVPGDIDYNGDMQSLLAALSELEFFGYISALPGNSFEVI